MKLHGSVISIRLQRRVDSAVLRSSAAEGDTEKDLFGAKQGKLCDLTLPKHGEAQNLKYCKVREVILFFHILKKKLYTAYVFSLQLYFSVLAQMIRHHRGASKSLKYKKADTGRWQLAGEEMIERKGRLTECSSQQDFKLLRIKKFTADTFHSNISAWSVALSFKIWPSLWQVQSSTTKILSV